MDIIDYVNITDKFKDMIRDHIRRLRSMKMNNTADDLESDLDSLEEMIDNEPLRQLRNPRPLVGVSIVPRVSCSPPRSGGYKTIENKCQKTGKIENNIK